MFLFTTREGKHMVERSEAKRTAMLDFLRMLEFEQGSSEILNALLLILRYLIVKGTMRISK